MEYLSRSGFFQVLLSGQLDLEGMRSPDNWAGLVRRESHGAVIEDGEAECVPCHLDMGSARPGGVLPAHRLRLFADLFLGDEVYGLVEVRSDRGEAPSDGDVVVRLEQAYLRLSGGAGSSGFQVGRFASPFGSYPLRHLTTSDPFLRPPLAYDYRTTMNRTFVASDVEHLLLWKDRARFFRRPGAPPIWGVPYQWGAMLFGTLGALDARVAVMNSAPSSEPEAWNFSWDRVDHPSVVLGGRLRLHPGLEVGASFNRGPWMEPILTGTINPPTDAPAGMPAPHYRSFDQELISVDVSFLRGPAGFRAEVMRDRWEVPNVDGRPTEHIYSAEIQYDLWAGVSVATRLGYIDFRPLDDGVGGKDDWDYDVYRYEASLGYRLARNAGILLSGYRQIQRVAEDGDTHLIGARLWWAF